MEHLETFYGKLLMHYGGNGEGVGPGMMNWWHGFGWGMPVMFFIFWIAVIVGIIFLIRWLSASVGSKVTETESAIDIIKKRYARGEINKEEFEEKLKDLES